MKIKRIILAPLAICKNTNKGIITKDELSIVCDDRGNSSIFKTECTKDKVYFDFWQHHMYKKSLIKVAEIEYDDTRNEGDFVNDAKILRIRDFKDSDLNNLNKLGNPYRTDGFINELSTY